MQWNLIKLRKDANLTQKEIADMIGISDSAYSRKESGESSFKDFEMFKIREIFKKPIDDIFLPTNCIDNAKNEMRATQ